MADLKNRRYMFLINPPFQLRYSFFVSSWLIPMLVVFPILMFEIFEYVIRLANRLDLPIEILGEIQDRREEVLMLLILAIASFTIATFFISLRLSHKIAGPLFKMSRIFRQTKDGHLSPELRFRKSDHFHELANDYNGMLAMLRKSRGTMISEISTTIARLENTMLNVPSGERTEIEKSIAELQAVQTRLK